jgi:hypothetical protein
MSYLLEHTRVRPASTAAARRGARVDECTLLNHRAFDGGAHVRVFVEDTTNRRVRRRRIPSPRLKLRIADCTNTMHLEFSVDTPEARSNSLFKIETLLAVLRHFHTGLAAEAELREERESARRRQ